MRYQKIIARIVTGFFLIIIALPSNATLITFGFTGTVSAISDVSNVLGGSVGVGTAFSGEYTFESTALGSSFAEVTNYFSAVTSATVTIGGNKFIRSGLDSNILVADGAGFASSSGSVVRADIYQVLTPLFVPAFAFSITLVDTSETAFNDTALPLAPPVITLSDPQNNLLHGLPHQFEIHE